MRRAIGKGVDGFATSRVGYAAAMPVNLAVIYYSSTGTIDTMARRAAATGEKTGAEVRLRQVQELAPDERHRLGRGVARPRRRHGSRAHGDARRHRLGRRGPARLPDPVRQRREPAQALPRLARPAVGRGQARRQGLRRLHLRQTDHGGQESTLLALYNTIHHFGGIIVPPGYTDPLKFDRRQPLRRRPRHRARQRATRSATWRTPPSTTWSSASSTSPASSPTRTEERHVKRSGDRTDHHRHPRTTRPPALEPMALAGGDRARNGVDPRRARGDHRRIDVRRPRRPQDRPGAGQLRGRLRGRDLRRGRLHRRPLLRPAHRPVRAEEAVPDHARRLHRRHRAHGVLDEPRPGTSPAGSSPAPASAGSTPRSTPRSTS